MVRKSTTGYLVQDVGIFALLVSVLVGVLTIVNGDKTLYLEGVVMLLGIFISILFAAYKMTSIAIVVAGFEVLVYSAYKLFMLYSFEQDILWICYIWIVLPLVSVGAMSMFVSGSHRTETENDILKEQVEELVMVNALTGLYNLRSLYNDLSKQISYTERNGLPLSLMIIRLRYEPELRKVLSRSHYEAMVQKLAQIVVDAVRIEDRVYSLDNNGAIGVLLTCDKEGTQFVVNRIKSRVGAKEAFAGITDEAVKVDVKIATVQYNKEEYGDDIVSFKQRAESELQYDV